MVLIAVEARTRARGGQGGRKGQVGGQGGGRARKGQGGGPKPEGRGQGRKGAIGGKGGQGVGSNRPSSLNTLRQRPGTGGLRRGARQFRVLCHA